MLPHTRIEIKSDVVQLGMSNSLGSFKNSLENVLLSIDSIKGDLINPQHRVLEIKGFEPTIVGVDGIFGSWYKDGIKKYLLNRGQHAYLLDWGSQTDHINNYVKKLENFISKNGIKKPILVGTSVGGVITLLYALKVGWNEITKIITISSPFEGVRVPSIAKIFPGVRDVLPKSKIIEVVRNTQTPTGKIISIRGEKDEMLIANGVALAGSEEVTLPYIGHSKSQLASPELVQTLDKYLDSI